MSEEKSPGGEQNKIEYVILFSVDRLGAFF